MSFEQLRINLIGSFEKKEKRDFQIALALNELGHLLKLFDWERKQEELAVLFPADLTVVLHKGLKKELVEKLPGLKILWLAESKEKENSNPPSDCSEDYNYVFYLRGDRDSYLKQVKELLKEIKGISFHPSDFKLGVMFNPLGEITLDFAEYFKAVQDKLAK